MGEVYLREQIDRLEARVARLEAGLRDISSWGQKFDAKGTHSKRVVDRAQEALREVPAED